VFCHLPPKPTKGPTYLSKPEVPGLAEQHHYKLNKVFKKAQKKYLERKAVRNNENKSASNLKHKICYTCRGKGHLGKDCPNGKSLTWSTIFIYSLGGPCAGRMIKSSTTRPKAIWVPKSLLTNLQGSNSTWVPKCA
jgi:hypothetical protein